MDPEYQSTDWYKGTTNYEKLILARLQQAQKDQGDMEPLGGVKARPDTG